MEYLPWFILDIVMGSFGLLLAGKITDTQINLQEAAISMLAAALLNFVPEIGWLLSIIGLLVLLKWFTEAAIWPDLILLVIVSRIFAILATFAVIKYI